MSDIFNSSAPDSDASQAASQDNNAIAGSLPLSGLYENWFLDYASYVILERAVPTIEDGLKPVQRRLLHSMFDMHDGRYHKVANVIGQTMQYHPHGDASIGEALVNMGQKDLLIDTQGNWGDVRTGDSAAAARYIEARLSKFALDILFNPQTTKWQLSYDGRKREPTTLPVKFPLVLAQGVEGIAVGLATKILPHNFNELIEACIATLRGKKFELFPDFPTGGLCDVKDYEGGKRGGRVRVRAKIEQLDKQTLVIKEIPFGTTTGSLIDSIIKANTSGKIKIKQVIDNTAAEVEVLVKLAAGVSPDVTISALYAFTDCEVSISPNACVIVADKPHFLRVEEILKYNADYTQELLRQELEIRKQELLEKIFFSSLERLFIEEGIYKRIEDCQTWEAVIATIHAGLAPFAKDFYRAITDEDVLKLTEIKIKRISKFDKEKADDLRLKMETELQEVEHHLANLTDYAVAYFKELKRKYGAGRERKTQLTSFDTIEASVVAANNAKLYINRAEGFIGFGLKKDEFVCDCSDIDDVIVFREDGIMKVVKIAEKLFVGKGVIHIDIFRKGDDRKVYNMAYLDGKTGRVMVKRFQVLGVTRDREYQLATEHKLSKVHYFSANPNGEAEIVNVLLSNACKAKVKTFDFNFAELEIKGRTAVGNILTKYPIRRIKLLKEGESTLGALTIYYDPATGTLNKDAMGKKLGEFENQDAIIAFYKDGSYEITNYELTNRYEIDKLVAIEKFNPDLVISAVYLEGISKNVYIKRFKIETTTQGKPFQFISVHKDSAILGLTTEAAEKVELYFTKDRKKQKIAYPLHTLEEVKGWRALGRKLEEPNIYEAKFILPQKEAETAQNGLTFEAE
ncbi:DNA gyrase/topoisomerase IV subunit A [Hugenholtzia roseola]|uniref:DNA gyrase/topoisomerase IV subunit A n=1 Tax=Hugenholtzia roseola TaxID=1002 RepID=UPI0006890025|nr:DNA gyrase/topoisomerase IV subunit A [Hugenholtzia roseola]